LMTLYRPMLTKSAPAPFTDKDWIFEVKWDGFRAIAYVKESFSLKSRNGRELIHNFPEVIELNQLTKNVVVDGELVIFRGGKVDFEAMQQRSQLANSFEIDQKMRSSPATYVVFDILEKDGKPLVGLPLMERKRILRESVKDGDHVVVSDYVEGQGEAYFKIVSEKGLEGIVAKRKTSPYEQGLRTGSWLKIKNLKTCDCVIFGYTKGEGSRSSTFGSLVLGVYDVEKKPVYVGNVGTGFDQALLESLVGKLKKIVVGTEPFECEPYKGRVTWVEPRLVCEVVYMAVTPDLSLRHPRFKRLREDKAPSESTIDQILPL
jgi:DNA ligase D-like protein (predicted ligase)